MKKREAEFGTLFRHWLKTQRFTSAAFELKQTTGTSLPFSDVPDHQLDALQAATTDHGILYKAPDDSRGVKPFDFFYLRNEPAYIVIRYPNSFHIISVGTFLFEKERSKRKSLTQERASDIAIVSVDI